MLMLMLIKSVAAKLRELLAADDEYDDDDDHLGWPGPRIA